MRVRFSLIILAFALIATPACKKFERLVAVITLSADQNTRLVRGEVIDVAESTVEYGFCWSTNSNPTLTDNSSKLGTTSSPKVFETTLGTLQPDTYYIRAYAKSGAGTVYGAILKMVITGNIIQYYYDDGESDYGWRYNAGYEGWMGNYFPISTSGEIIAIEMYFNHFDGHGTDQLNVDVFNSSRNLIGSTYSFTPGDDSWVTIDGNGILYSGAIYVMVHWNYTVNPTNYLGMDQNGPNASMDLGYYRSGDLTWGKTSSLSTGNLKPGIFLLRIQVELSSGKTVTYTPRPDPVSGDLVITESAGSEASVGHNP